MSGDKKEGVLIISGDPAGYNNITISVDAIDSDCYIIDDSTLWDRISVNGRASKKLFEKIVLPELEKLEKAVEILREANHNIASVQRPDYENDFFYWAEKINIEANEAEVKVKELLK